MLTLKQLEAFYWIFHLGSFTKAAEQLRMTQSTISMRMYELEQSISAKMFTRTPNGILPTAKAKDLIIYVERLLKTTHEMEEVISSPASMGGYVRLGAVELVATTWLSELLLAVERRYPRIVLEIEVEPSFDLVNRLQAGKLDLVLAAGNWSGADFFGDSLGSLAFKWMASPGLGVPDVPLALTELLKWPLLTLASQAFQPLAYQKWLSEKRHRFGRILTCNRMGVLADLVIAGHGVSLLPPRCFTSQLEEGRLCILSIAAEEWTVPEVELFVLTSANETRPVAQALARLAVEVSGFRNQDDIPVAAGEPAPGAEQAIDDRTQQRTLPQVSWISVVAPYACHVRRTATPGCCMALAGLFFIAIAFVGSVPVLIPLLRAASVRIAAALQ